MILKIQNNSGLSFASGLDFIKHGGVAYPHKAQGDGWHNITPRYSMELRTHIPTEYKKQLSIDSVKEIDESKILNLFQISSDG